MRIFQGRRSRKGDLNLSINAIVVLILAIVVLGLGLGFIRNVFGGATTKLGESLDSVSLQNPADANNPITVDDVTMKRNAKKEIEVGVYNKDVNARANVGLYISECRDTAGKKITETSGNQNPTIAAPVKESLESSSGTGFKAILSWIDEAKAPPVGTYVCIVEAKQGVTTYGSGTEFESQQFFVRISS